MRGVFATLIFVAGIASAQAEVPRIKSGTPYRAARAVLLASGYKPVRRVDADKCYESDMRCQGRPEMHRCSGTGLGYCWFLWEKDGATIEVITVGEGEPGVERVRCESGCR